MFVIAQSLKDCHRTYGPSQLVSVDSPPLQC